MAQWPPSSVRATHQVRPHFENLLAVQQDIYSICLLRCFLGSNFLSKIFGYQALKSMFLCYHKSTFFCCFGGKINFTKSNFALFLLVGPSATPL